MEVLKVKKTKGGHVATLTMIDGNVFSGSGATRAEAVQKLNAAFMSWSMDQNRGWDRDWE